MLDDAGSHPKHYINICTYIYISRTASRQTYFAPDSPVATMLDDADVYFAFIFAFDYTLYFYAAESRLKYFLGPMQARVIVYIIHGI